MVNEEEIEELRDLGANEILIKAVQIQLLTFEEAKKQIESTSNNSGGDGRRYTNEDISIDEKLNMINQIEKKVYYHLLNSKASDEFIFIRKEQLSKKLKITPEQLGSAIKGLVSIGLLLENEKTSKKGYKYKVHRIYKEERDIDYSDLF